MGRLGAFRAEGAAGGILVMWDSRIFSKKGMIMGAHFVSCLLKRVVDDKLWVFSGVYGPCSDVRRVELWEELLAVKHDWNPPWCIGGIST